MSADDIQIMTYVVLDTNFFLHFQPIDEVDWTDLLNSDRVTLVLPQRIIEELDEQKDQNPRQKLRSRARKAQQRIERFLIEGQNREIRDSVTIEHVEKLPTEFFEENDLDRSTPDDHLAATALHIEDRREGGQVLIVTDDTGPRLTAEPRGIETLRPPDDLRLQSARSEMEKELRKHRLENERLKNRIPELELCFEGGDIFSKFEVSRPNLRTDQEIEQKVSQIEDQYPEKKPEEERDENPMSQFGMIGEIGIPPRKEFKRYNRELPEFYDDYHEYLKRRRDHRELMGRTLELNLILHNNGTSPAKDIDIFLHFPDGFLLTDSKPVGPSEPDPPRPPQSPEERLQSFNLTTPSPASLPPSATSPSNVSAPEINETNSYEVDIHVRKLKHDMQESLPPLYVVYESYEEAQSFDIGYRINTANVPDPVDGTLKVVVEK